jgi:hypothetical protein
MTMNLVGQQTLFEVPSPLNAKGEDIVYSVIERYSRKASEPTTTRRSSTSSLIALNLDSRFSGVFISYFFNRKQIVII